MYYIKNNNTLGRSFSAVPPRFPLCGRFIYLHINLDLEFLKKDYGW
jgi:hypothetical protein